MSLQPVEQECAGAEQADGEQQQGDQRLHQREATHLQPHAASSDSPRRRRPAWLMTISRGRARPVASQIVRVAVLAESESGQKASLARLAFSRMPGGRSRAANGNCLPSASRNARQAEAVPPSGRQASFPEPVFSVRQNTPGRAAAIELARACCSPAISSKVADLTEPARRAVRIEGNASPARMPTIATPKSSSMRVTPRLPFRIRMCRFCCRACFWPRSITAVFALFRIAGEASARILRPMPMSDLDPTIVESLNQRLTRAGVRPTAQRLRIAALLLGRPQ